MPIDLDKQFESTLRKEQVLGRHSTMHPFHGFDKKRGFHHADVQKAAEESRKEEKAKKEHEMPNWDNK